MKKIYALALGGLLVMSSSLALAAQVTVTNNLPSQAFSFCAVDVNGSLIDGAFIGPGQSATLDTGAVTDYTVAARVASSCLDPANDLPASPSCNKSPTKAKTVGGDNNIRVVCNK